MSRTLTALAILCLLPALPAVAIQQPTAEFPPDFDLRQPVDTGELQASRDEIAERFLEQLGSGLGIHWGDLSDRPLYVLRLGDVLGVVLAGDAVAGARSFLRDGREAFGLSDREVDRLEAAKVYRTAATGWTHVQFLQRIEGISVFRGQVRVNLDARGGVLNVGGEYFPGLEVPAGPAIGAEQALRVAALGLGLSGTVPEVLERQLEGERYTRFAAGGEYLEPPDARLVLLPESPGEARLVWEVTIWEAVSGWDNLYRVLVDARSGEAVLRQRLTLYQAAPADATGEVFDCKDPDTCGQTIESFAGDAVASPSNWVNAVQTETRGNNVISRRDWRGRNLDDTNQAADGGPDLEFHFPFTNDYANTGNWRTDKDVAITNAFYWGNFIHDHWYDLGFDEASGNYQDDNFGRGGLANDHVNVDVQDSANTTLVRNNANWSPTLDGSPPRTNYFLWTNPNRDGAFGAKVIWHEFGHGLSTRLVGGPSTQCLGGAQGGGMGEGWGDWVAINYFGEEGNEAGPETIGEYVTGDPDGIRRYPYAYDLAIDPLTYADLCNQGCEVHREGEIWASVLWDMRHDLAQQHGFSEAQLRSEQLVIDAMKLSACSPNFVTMRDSVLQADEQRYGFADECLIRSAFARRGLGARASSNGSGGDATADFSLILPLGDSLRFDADKTTLSWDARADAVAYRVARGDFGSDAATNTFDNAGCQGEVFDASYQDTELPLVGNGFYYVVAVEDDCFRSDYGAGTDGATRPVTDCP